MGKYLFVLILFIFIKNVCLYISESEIYKTGAINRNCKYVSDKNENKPDTDLSNVITKPNKLKYNFPTVLKYLSRSRREDDPGYSKDLLYNPFIRPIENKNQFVGTYSNSNNEINLSSNPFLKPVIASPSVQNQQTKPLPSHTTTIKPTEIILPNINRQDIFYNNPFFNGAIAISSSNGNVEVRPLTNHPKPTEIVTTSRPKPIEIVTLRPKPSTILQTTTVQHTTSQIDIRIPQSSTVSPHPFADYPNGDICGRPSMIQLIVKGHEVETGAFPWIAALYHIYDESHFTYQCGASLVSHKHIITAAHCVVGKLNKPSEIFFKLGKVNIDDESLILDSKHGVFIASEIHLNPEYNVDRHSAHGDIAVVVLSETVTFNQYIRPICLWIFDSDLSIVVDSVGVVVGWGRDETGMISTSAKSSMLPIVSQEECLRSSAEYFILTSNTTFCAGNRDATGPCSGDSGSGLVQSRGGRYILRGVVSTALVDGTKRHKCDLSKYLIFADCGKYQNWLLSFIK